MKKCYDTRGVAPESQVYGNSVTTLKGELENIKILDAAQDDGTRIWPSSFDSGRPVDPATMPKFLQRIGPREHPLLDFYSMAQSLVVPETFKRTVEELEPGIHQFFKMQIVEQNDKNLTPIGERYWMVICNRLETLHETLCEPPLKSNGFPQMRTKRLVFSAKRIGKTAIWIDKKVLDQCCFISETLHEELVALNMTGVKFTAFDVAD